MMLDFKFKNVKIKNEELYKIIEISSSLQDYHILKRKDKKIRKKVESHTLSLNSYRDINHSPDLLFDEDTTTTWRIINLENIDERTLYLPAPGDKKNKIQILSGNHGQNESFNKFYRPKKIRLSLQGYTYMNNKEKKNDSIYREEFILKDSKDFQEIVFKPNIFTSFFENYNSYSIKLEILDFYKGEISNCDIAELNVVSIDN
ncbi:MAG: hypothetical protein JXN64_09410 [Spirochaetes bacterium]|nr:hypothetical protein [Spirochaetota bacterium]